MWNANSSAALLVNNAASSAKDRYELTEDGIEKAVAVKHVPLLPVTLDFANPRRWFAVISVISSSLRPYCPS